MLVLSEFLCKASIKGFILKADILRYIEQGITLIRNRVFTCEYKCNSITSKETNKETSDKIIKIMKELGVLEHKGSTKKGMWIVY